MSRAASPFSPRTLIAVLVVGAGAFLLLLYAIGAGWEGQRDNNGGAHAAANGLNGFAGLVQLLEKQGHEVTVSRSESRLNDEGLLVLTPQRDADGGEIAEIIGSRRYVGPTLVILPKWLALSAGLNPGSNVPADWVHLGDAVAPEWVGDVVGTDWDEEEQAYGGAEAEVVARKRWRGMGLAGGFPTPKQVVVVDPETVQTDEWDSLLPLVTDETGDFLVGYLNDDGNYPRLDQAAGFSPNEDADPDIYPVVIVIEPDLMNNYGLADRRRAELAVALVTATLSHDDTPVTFDLTAAGLARSQNLLTLAFQPPFLAATLCLILAALVVAWRAFRRFGPPVAEAPTAVMGKRQLARNSGGLVARARRLHLLGPPYAALVGARIAEALGVREVDPQAREAAIARILAGRGLAGDYIDRADALRRARHPAELLRAAGALRTIERTLKT